MPASLSWNIISKVNKIDITFKYKLQKRQLSDQITPLGGPISFYAWTDDYQQWLYSDEFIPHDRILPILSGSKHSPVQATCEYAII